jgi:Cu/Ag efflux pump CusA
LSIALIVRAQCGAVQENSRKDIGGSFSASERRITLTLIAAAASLALIPIAREIFWGPMAYAMMGGIIVGTVLTLLFLPALYVAWFRVEEPAGVGAGAEGASMCAQEPSGLPQPAALPIH